MRCQKMFENPVPLSMNLRITTLPVSVTVEKLAGIFTKRIWQPYLRETNVKKVAST